MFFIVFFFSQLNNQSYAQATTKYKVVKAVGTIVTCVPAKAGETGQASLTGQLYDTAAACQKAANDLNNPLSWSINGTECKQDFPPKPIPPPPNPNGPYTYSQCQDKLLDTLHPGNTYHVVIRHNPIGDDFVGCESPGGNKTYSECRDEINNQKAAAQLFGENPCGTGTTNECQTGLGSISTDPSGFANRILSIAIGLGGGIALILMVIGSIRVLTSSGDQQKLNGGRDQIVAAIAGLLFLIFSIIILRFIGLEILKGVPGIGS